MSAGLTNLISGLAEKHGLAGLVEDDQGRFEWYIDGRKVRVFSSCGKIYLVAVIRQLPAEGYHRSLCLKTALKTSLANAYAHREAIFLDGESDSLHLYRSVSLINLGLLEFEALLESFMRALEGFTELTAQPKHSTTTRLTAV